MTPNQAAKFKSCIKNDPELWYLTNDMIEVLLYLYDRQADTPEVRDIGYKAGLDETVLWPTLCRLSFYNLIVPFQEGAVVSRRFGIMVKGIKLLEKFYGEVLSVEG